MEKVSEIIKKKQPEIFKKLQWREHQKEQLSFKEIDKMMKNNKGIDERKCR